MDLPASADGCGAEIDAPEKSQPFGTTSKQSLSNLCLGKEAEVKPRAIDRYKRTVARVTWPGIDANAEQVNRGMASVSDSLCEGSRSLCAGA